MIGFSFSVVTSLVLFAVQDCLLLTLQMDCFERRLYRRSQIRRSSCHGVQFHRRLLPDPRGCHSHGRNVFYVPSGWGPVLLGSGPRSSKNSQGIIVHQWMVHAHRFVNLLPQCRSV